MKSIKLPYKKGTIKSIKFVIQKKVPVKLLNLLYKKDFMQSIKL